MRSVVYAPPRADASIGDVPGGELTLVPTSWPVVGHCKARILIASSQPILRHGLRALLTAEAELDVVAEAEDGASAIALARRLRPDVVLIDLHLPDLDGLTATRMIRSTTADTYVVVLAGANDDALALESIRAGASAYLSRSMHTDLVVRTIRDASAGHVTLPSNAISRLVRDRERHGALSERESDVLRLVARGKANKQIARELGIAPSTVKSHVGSLMSKLGLGSRTQLALYAARSGLVALDHDETTDAQTERFAARVASQPSARALQLAAWPAGTQA
jgi:two-component system, NarL family, response regulator LiaR